MSDKVVSLSQRDPADDQMEVIVLDPDVSKPVSAPDALQKPISAAEQSDTGMTATETRNPNLQLFLDRGSSGKPSSKTETGKKSTSSKPRTGENSESERQAVGSDAVRKEAWIHQEPKSSQPSSVQPQLTIKALPAAKFSADVMYMKHAIEQIMLVKIKQRREAEKSFRSYSCDIIYRNCGVLIHSLCSWDMKMLLIYSVFLILLTVRCARKGLKL